MSTRNPFTRLLGRRLDQKTTLRLEIDAFVEPWDLLEALVISIYRTGSASEEDQGSVDEVTRWLAERYSAYENALAPHWAGTRAAGQTVESDPFRSLFSDRSAASFIGDWSAMQTLPAAREALNRWLLALSRDDDHITSDAPSGKQERTS